MRPGSARSPRRARTPRQAYPYVYPFMDYSVGRVDQGQDFTGKGPILAIGKAEILSTGAPGWPEGGGVLYKLLEGPFKGRNIFVYEGVDVPKSIKPGMVVPKGKPIATFRPGGSIETGFADPSGVPLSHANYIEGKETGWGKHMKAFLEAVEKHTPPAQLGHLQGAPSFLDEAGRLITHPGEVPGEDAKVVKVVPKVGEEVANALGGLFASHAEALMLNIGLVGGGAFLVYYGIALMMGVKSPVKAPVKAAAEAAAVAPK